MKRGQIFYIKSVNTLGPHDDKWGRPGIVVSADHMIEKLDSVLVVPLTTNPHYDLPTHVGISSTGTESTALCERVYWVHKDRIGDLCGELTEAEEERVSWALMIALGLDLCTDEDDTRLAISFTADDRMMRLLKLYNAKALGR